MKTTGDWRKDLLKQIGAPVTGANLKLLTSWHRWEGGHTNNRARYNWLNTTIDAPGAVESINSVGVKAFKSYKAGINALAATLLNGRYNSIVRGFRKGDPYKYDIGPGLQIWVSGSPTGNPGYAQKVMGGGAPKATQPRRSGGGGGAKGNLALAPPPPAVSPFMEIAFADDPEFLSLLKSMGTPAKYTSAGVPDSPAADAQAPKGDLILPTKWKGTHVTDGLGWGTPTASDIMGKAGTRVGAPEDGVIVYYHPTGAQGGGSMLFRSNSGKEYWIGHIDGGLKAGARVRRGQTIAQISADHPRPHVHIDKR